ncbi:hypothetical protein BGI32_03170 [Snodgrassella alvi]|uniref:Uncharacterized protein n=1 Tax=Snodgrassella alvi TaxID=1196083 RepID=A0A2N9WVF5_9NEIS|nr:hypothetical protein BGI32_03170 [Snodgrassella alvi]
MIVLSGILLLGSNIGNLGKICRSLHGVLHLMGVCDSAIFADVKNFVAKTKDICILNDFNNTFSLC